MNADTWVQELEAERVTHSWEPFAEMLQRLERERPESPTQIENRARMEHAAKLRVRIAQYDDVIRHADQYTRLEKKLAEAHIERLMAELMRTKRWVA